MASDHHSRSAKLRTPRSNGSERQQWYRAAHKLCSIDISQATAALLAQLRTRTGLGNDGVIAAAELLAGKPKLVRKLAKAHAAPAGTAQRTKAQPRAEPRPSPSVKDTTASPDVGQAAALAPAVAPAAPTAAGRRSATGPRRRRKVQPTPDPKQSKLDLG